MTESVKPKRTKSSGVAYEDVTALDKLRRLRQSWLLRGLLLAAVAALVAAAYHYADRKHLAALVQWVDAHRMRGAAVLVAVQITCTICLIPTAVLAIAAGALFGFTGGLLLIWAACVVGETLAFALGRHLFRAHIERVSAAWPTWVAMEAALREDGWKLVLLLRCCPASPFTLLNYALGSTSLPFSHFFWPSVVGIAPGIALYVWGGNLIKDLSEVTGGPGGGGLGHAAPPQARVAFAVVSGVTAVLVLVGSAWYTKRALARRLARVESGAHDDAELGRQGSGCSRQAVLCNSNDAARPGMAHRASVVGGRARQAQQQQQQQQQQQEQPAPQEPPQPPAHPPPAPPQPQQQDGHLPPLSPQPQAQPGHQRLHLPPPAAMRSASSQQHLLAAGGL